MKKATFIGSLGAVSLLLFSACDDSLTLSKGTGTIFPLVDVDPTVVTSRSSRAGSEIGDLTASDLTLTLTSADGSVNESFAYPDFPTDKAYPVGEYTLTASYGSDSEEGFEKPAVSGSCSLTVSEGKASKPSIVAIPSKAMVALEFDEGLLNYMTSVSARLHSAGGTYVEYPVTETRAAYLKPGNTTVSVSFTKPNGKEGNLEVANFNAEAQHRYTLALKLGGDGYGSAEAITVKYDDMLELEDVSVDISDDVLSVPAPEVTAIGFTPGETVTIIEGAISGELKPQMQVLARGEIAKAVLTTANCPSLIDLGWPEEVDLCAASDAQIAAMQALGLKAPGLTGVTGKMGLLDLTQVLTHIQPRNSALAPSEFTLAVTDKGGKTCDPVTFSVKVERLELQISHEGFYEGESTIDLDVEYNGSDIENNVKFEYVTDRGVWADAEVLSIRQSRASYVATIAVPANALIPLQIRASVASVTTVSEIEIKPVPGPEISAVEENVFAKYAWIDFASDIYDCSEKELDVRLSTDGVVFTPANATQEGATVKITGLTPGTTYKVRGYAGALASDDITITTEAAAQIPGGDMESWTAKSLTAGANTWNYHDPNSPWASNNDLAFSKKSAMAMRSAVSCVDLAGEAHGGSKAGMVRNIGYGASTTFSSSSNYAAGELTLGDSNSGTAFSSRPSSISFWTKYVPYNNGDKGLAEVAVFDASGAEIASGRVEVDPSSVYIRHVFDFTYTRGTAKAASIKVRFRSSATDNYLNKNGVNSLSGGNISGQFTGSYMYIDDVELAY